MLKKVKLLMIAITIGLFGTLAPIAATSSVSAIDPFKGCGGSGSTVCKGKDDNLMNIIGKVINALLLLVGSIAVIAIIISGIRFITADGDPQKIASARNGVIYSVVGIAVSVMAFAIVRFVLSMTK